MAHSLPDNPLIIYYFKNDLFNVIHVSSVLLNASDTCIYITNMCIQEHTHTHFGEGHRILLTVKIDNDKKNEIFY